MKIIRKSNTLDSLKEIRKLVNKGIKPFYIYGEQGRDFKRLTTSLGFKDGDFLSHLYA